MKSYFSLILSSVLFLTQTWSVSLMAQTQGPEISNKDIRLQLALTIEQEGVKLQAIQEKDGIEVAHHFFNETVKDNFKMLSLKAASLTEKMSEEEARQNIETIKKYLTNSDERISGILYDRGLPNKQKLTLLQSNQSFSKFETATQAIQARAEAVGYEKALKEISDQFRSRYPGAYSGGGAATDEEIAEAFGLIFIVLIVVAGVVALGPSIVAVLSSSHGPIIGILVVLALLSYAANP